MHYETFKEQILAALKKELPNAALSIEPVMKNNDVTLDGLIIMEEGTNISPTLYLNYYYDVYLEQSDFTAALTAILTTYRANQPEGSVDVSFFTNYHNITDKIVYKLINYEKNKVLLNDVPHYRYLDLAIVFYCLISTSVTGNATILIRNRHLLFWDISKGALLNTARHNTPKLLKYDLRNMTEIMAELLKQENDLSSSMQKEDTALCPMYVLTNQSKLNGASCILYSHLLEAFSRRLDCDLYILPSSIHEVILIPAKDNTTYGELSQMVQDVNHTQVAPDEVLSDHVYYFSRKSNSISM